jgi:hypothetical protein
MMAFGWGDSIEWYTPSRIYWIGWPGHWNEPTGLDALAIENRKPRQY